MTKREKQWLAIIIVAYLGISFVTGSFDPRDWLGAGVAAYYYGNVTIQPTESDYFDGTANAGSSSAYTFYHGATGYKGVTGTSVSTSGTTIEFTPDDKGYGYMKLYSGTADFIADWALRASNPRIKEVWWEDIDSDGKNDLMCKIYIGDLGIRGQASTPALTLNIPMITEDVSGETEDSPDDQTGIGETEVVKQITWDCSGLSEKTGAYMARIYFTTNTTTGGEDLRLEELTITGWGVSLSWEVPIREADGDYAAYYHDPSDYKELNNAIAVYRGVNKADQMTVTVNARCMYETNDNVEVTLKIDFLDSDKTIAVSISDGVCLDEA